MIGKESPAEMRRYIRAKLGLTDAELTASFNQRILEAGSPTAGDTLRLLRDALLRETKRKLQERPNKKRTKAKK
ncbi:MAG TPA: hypothetical protein VN641_04565 [Urbifossiella sp.]|nr:hypothetical protein [Urbifossiella sp.]